MRYGDLLRDKRKLEIPKDTSMDIDIVEGSITICSLHPASTVPNPEEAISQPAMAY